MHCWHAVGGDGGVGGMFGEGGDATQVPALQIWLQSELAVHNTGVVGTNGVVGGVGVGTVGVGGVGEGTVGGNGNKFPVDSATHVPTVFHQIFVLQQSLALSKS